MQKQTKPVIFGSVGMGGYAGHAIDALLEESACADPVARLHAVSEPMLASHPKRVAQLQAAGVKILESYDDLLAEPIDALWIPLPIQLHRPFTQKAIAAGKAVLCEKPAAGCIDDVIGMMSDRDRAGKPVAIGFQNIYDPSVHEAKRALLAGEIGTPKVATIVACWPRDSRYYSRNAWAGALKRDGTWVLDSPVNNALAHFLNLALYLLGPDLRLSAEPQEVEAELYRANPIENFDTCALRITVAGGATVLVYFTHACTETHDPVIEIKGSGGAMRFVSHDRFEISPTGKPTRTFESGQRMASHVVRGFCDWMRGGESVVATLEMARCHSVVCSAASEASPVYTIAESFISTLPQADHAVLRAIDGIEALFASAAAERKLLSETGRADWSRPGGILSTRGYTSFAGPKTE